MQWFRRQWSKDHQITKILSSVIGELVEEGEPWQSLIPQTFAWSKNSSQGHLGTAVQCGVLQPQTSRPQWRSAVFVWPEMQKGAKSIRQPKEINCAWGGASPPCGSEALGLKGVALLFQDGDVNSAHELKRRSYDMWVRITDCITTTLGRALFEFLVFKMRLQHCLRGRATCRQ